MEPKVATGFHRNTPLNTEGGVDREEFRVRTVADRVSTTAKVFLGLTLECAQCHAHKYDPFSQRDYYQFFAFFNSDVEVDIPAPLPEEVEAYNQKKAEYDGRRAELEAAIATYKKDRLSAAQQQWERELKLPELRKLPGNIRAILLVEPDKRTEQQKKELADHYAKLDPKLAELNKALADHQKAAPAMTQAQTLALGPPRKTHILIRGDFLRPGVEVQSGTPAVLPPLRPKGARGGERILPTRLDLAKWIVDPANPLTARVAVNRLWQHLFGRGLVVTVEDFGTQGERPSHPELLDWLASEFIQVSGERQPPDNASVSQSWSQKAMIKLIVQSATYRQASQTRPELLDRDPSNTLLARQNRFRVEGEIVRDLSLAASGLLNPIIGGPSVRLPGLAAEAKADRYGRGLYIFVQRTVPYPMLTTFDAPDSHVTCTRRDRSNTPLQALTLLNDEVFVQCAQALGHRILKESPGTTAERIRYAFRLCLAREPGEREIGILNRLLEEQRMLCQADPKAAAALVGDRPLPNGITVPEAAAWIGVARTLLNLDEFVTRE